MSDINGLLPVNKPINMTSKDVSRWLIKRKGKLKLGHVGTLDPLASGVLPILIGPATKVQDYLLTSKKVYRLEMKFGFETPTLDLDSEPNQFKLFDHISKEQFLTILPLFIGKIEQTPPIYSAVKFKGKPLYDYARSGNDENVNVDALKREIEVFDIQMLSWNLPQVNLEISCSKGTYIRSLVRDIAHRLNSCATMTKLERVETAGVAIQNTYCLDFLEENLHKIESLVIPMENLSFELAIWQAETQRECEKIINGRELKIEKLKFEQRIKKNHIKYRPNEKENVLLLLDCSGKALAIGCAIMDQQNNINLIVKRGLR